MDERGGSRGPGGWLVTRRNRFKAEEIPQEKKKRRGSSLPLKKVHGTTNQGKTLESEII